MIALYRNSNENTTNTFSSRSALVGSVFEILVGTGVEILIVFEAKILVETVAIFLNVAVTSDIKLVAIAMSGICVDFNSFIPVDKTLKVIDIVLGLVNE